MAKIKEEIVPTEKTYLVELTQSELDFMSGIMSDLADNPQRKVSMVYGVDGTVVMPTDRGLEVANKFLDLAGTESPEYDYDDYWRPVEADETGFKLQWLE